VAYHGWELHMMQKICVTVVVENSVGKAGTTSEHEICFWIDTGRVSKANV
jgi:hypothetical protein